MRLSRRVVYVFLAWLWCPAAVLQAASLVAVPDPGLRVADTVRHGEGPDGEWLLDAYPDAAAAFGLRRLSSTYNGSAIRVRRSSDNTERDIGFDGEWHLDTAALLAFVGSGDGYVVTWYNQKGNGADLTNSVVGKQPQIVASGSLYIDETGLPRIHFDGAAPTFLAAQGSVSISTHNLGLFVVQEADLTSDNKVIFGLGPEKKTYNYIEYNAKDNGLWVYLGDSANWGTLGDLRLYETSTRVLLIADFKGTTARLFRNGSLVDSKTHGFGEATTSEFRIGSRSNTSGSGYAGYMAEVMIYPSRSDDDRQGIYDNINAYYQIGASGGHQQALLPQDWPYQVDLYDWLNGVRLSDVTLPSGQPHWDDSYANPDALADLWLTMRTADTPSRVTMAEPRWYVLNDGQGGGIEGTGKVRLMHSTGQGLERSWANEPAYWYQLSIPLAGGGQGNPYYQKRALAYRALVLAAVDMMMYDRLVTESSSYRRNDMYGKALLGWAEAYRWCKDILDARTRAAFEAGFSRFLDYTLRWGAHDINTNMDMFFVHAAAEIYRATSDATLRDMTLRSVKKVLFGYEDGVLGSRHDVLSGTFFPAGYIGEADGPETTYNGVSLYHILGAWSLVHDDPAWGFLREVARRMVKFKVYQYFKDPMNGATGKRYTTGPAGYANRTGASYVRDQANEPFRDLTAAYFFEEGQPLIRGYKFPNNHVLKDVSSMVDAVSLQVSRLANEWGVTYAGEAPEWNGWSPWVKENTYLPPRGWYTTLKGLMDANAPSIYTPFERDGYTFNEAFGGDPTGYEFWAYKADDGSQDFGFFIEADAQQGNYDGWYGGKLEAFWTQRTGMLIMNRHNKTGCDSNENTTCWDQIDIWGTHHVWGRDDSGTPTAFSTADIRNRRGERISRFNLQASPPWVEVVNVFNDPTLSGDDGQETGIEIQGELTIANRFEALSNGVRVTHTITSDASDKVRELWATLPVYLRVNEREQGGQENLPDATIEYWNGTDWRSASTSLVSTTALRIGRDYLDGQGARYGYVEFPVAQRVKLSENVWQESYQGRSRLRNVHIDLIGTNGADVALPENLSVSYDIITQAPPYTVAPTGDRQTVDLSPGWNVVSANVNPQDPRLSNVFRYILSDLEQVRDEQTGVYDPNTGTNTIGDWKPSEAYLVNVSAPVSLTFVGERIAPGTQAISLQIGKNLVPYLPDHSLPVEQALASIAGDLVLVKDEHGHIYHPATGQNAIGDLQPGQGYYVYVNRATTLTYPAN